MHFGPRHTTGLVLGIGLIVALCLGARDVATSASRWEADPPSAVSVPVRTTLLTRQGSLARALPLTTKAGWRLFLSQVDAGRGLYLVEVIPPLGHATTRARAARVLDDAARAAHDDPRAYRPLIPMSGLVGARGARR